MLKEHEEMIEKTIDTSAFLSGGQLNPAQQDTFVALVRKYSTLLPQTRFHRMTRPVEDIDKMHVGEPVTEAAFENTNSAYLSVAKFNKVTLTAKKLRSQWHITTEAIQNNIEQERLEDSLMNSFTERMATDFELLAIQGNTALTGVSPNDRLLKTLDGWYIQSQSSHVLDAAGASISKKLLAQAKRMMPKQYRNDPGLRWIMSDTLVIDWEDTLSDRETAGGDRVLGGGSMGAPLGTPILPVPLIPDDLSVAAGSTEASPAELIGVQQGPFVIDASNNQFEIEVDSVGTALTVTLPNGVHEAVVVANLINAALVADVNHGAAYGGVVSTDGFGRLVFTSPTTGAGSTLDFTAAALPGGAVKQQGALTLGIWNWDGSTAWANIALTGTAAGSASVYEGSFIMLCNPRNLIFSMLDGTRVFSEFDKDNDRIETTMYNQVDVQIENLDAIVLIDNIRLADLT